MSAGSRGGVSAGLRAGMSARASGGEARASVESWRRRLQTAAIARGVLAGLGAGMLVAALSRLLTASSTAPLVLGALAATVTAAATWWRAAAFRLTAQRTALWIEERDPSLRYSLVSASTEDVAPSARIALEKVLRSASWEVAARSALWRSLTVPSAGALVGAVALILLPRTATLGVAHSETAGRPGVSTANVAPLGTVTATVHPPRYSGLADIRSESPTLVRAYPGSSLSLEGVGPSAQTNVTLDDRALDVRAQGTRWSATLATAAARALLRVQRIGGETRLIAVEPLIDSAPRVTLHSPTRDSVLRTPQGTFTLSADVHDDLGLARAAFEYIISSGEGERFTFKSGTLGTLPAGSRTDGTLRATLSLAALGLAPGDIVHLRAVARDRNDVSGPGIGSSETRTLRIARADEYDSVAVEQAPPAEADKSVISQRMLINLTEALVKRAPRSTRADVVSESRRIGRDQARLRKQVSDIIFARLGDDADGEHFHGDGHGHGDSDSLAGKTLTPEQLLKAAEKATEISGAPTDFEHDETPVVAINRPMLEAYNAMWDAGRSLETGDPKRALPPMYVALRAIQRARAAERLYLRGTPPRVVVDLAKVRLQGKDKGTPSARTPRVAADANRAPLLARFARAIDVLARDASAGVDSLIVLRLAVADRLPAAATALEGAIGDVRASRDATASLLRARRALDDALVIRDSLAAWGSVR